MWQIAFFVTLAAAILLVIALLVVAGTAATHQSTLKRLHKTLLAELLGREDDGDGASGNGDGSPLIPDEGRDPDEEVREGGPDWGVDPTEYEYIGGRRH